MIDRVSFLVPPLFGIETFKFEQWQHNKAGRMQPLGVMYLAGYLRHHLPNIRFSIFDANVELPLYYRQHPELIENPEVDAREVMQGVVQAYLDRYRPDVIGISGLFHSVLHQFHFLARAAKQCLPDSPIMCGGPYPSGSPEMVLRDHSIDFVVKGEGESRTYNLLRYLQKEIGLEGLNGIVSRDEAGAPGESRFTGPQQIEQNLNLDHLPYPARDLIRQNEYTGMSAERSKDYLLRDDYLVGAIYSTRGCPRRCSYCNSGSNYYGPKFRWQSVENVVEEVNHCIEAYGIAEMQFYDENITAHRDHTYELFTALNELPINWTFGTLELENFEKRSLVEYTKKKKFSWFSVGMESGNDRVLREVAVRRADRRTMSEKMEMVRDVVGRDCFVNASFIVGFPGETISEMLDTVEFAKGVGIDWAVFYCYMPLPGTPLYDLCIREGYLDEANVDLGNVRPEICVLNTPDWTAGRVSQIRHWANYEVNFVHNHNIADDTEKAIRGFEYVLTVAPDHFFSYYALGECYLQAREPEKAYGYFAEAKKLESRQPYCEFLAYFDLPHIGRYRGRDLIGHQASGNGCAVSPELFYIPPAEAQAAAG